MYPDARQPQRGTSLIELVTLLAVAVIALGASVPLFSDVRAGMQLRGSMSHWMSSLALARTAALERGRNVVACPADGERCVASTFWHDGWILFEDRDRNGERSSDELLLLDRALFSDKPDYLLKVKGDSMRDDGIFDGDLVAVKRASEARNGQVVVARVDGEITIKRLERSKARIRLLPRNPEHVPIEVRAGQDFAIEGVYCGLVRRG